MFDSMTSQTRPADGRRSPDAGDVQLRGLNRVSELVRRWRSEKEDPEPFYSMLAADTVADLERRYGSMVGMRIADLGCGPGYYTRAFRAHGATVIPIDGSLDELSLAESPPPGAAIADAGRLPLADRSVDAVFCSNLLEHTPDASAVISDMERVLRPGGWGYLSWTNWYSPWGGHDMTPYQYLGPVLGPRLYERRHGPPHRTATAKASSPSMWVRRCGSCAAARAAHRARRAALLPVGVVHHASSGSTRGLRL